MKYFCHYCGNQLRPGYNYTVECNCRNCYLFFNKDGLAAYRFYFFEGGSDWCILKKPSDKNSFLFEKHRNSFGRYDGDPHQEYVPYADENAMVKGNFTILFDNGVPQVYKLFEKMKNLVVFS